MTGTLTVAADDIGGAVTRYTLSWTSDASGNATGTLGVRRGRLVQVRQLPSGAATQPTDQYDMTILDANSFDVLVGSGANISNAAASYFTPVLTGGYPMFLEAGTVSLAIANAGNAKSGQTILYICAADGTVVGTAVTRAASDATQAYLASVSGAITSGHAAQFADTTGTVADSGIAISSAAALSLVAGFAKHALVAGAAAGDVTVAGIKTTDSLNAVLRFIGAGTAITDITDLTSQFTISANGKINNTGGTASTGDKLLVLWTATT